MASKPTDAELLAFLVSHVHQHGSPRGMQQAAAVHFRVDRRTIYRWLADLRQRREIGRAVYRRWRDAG